MARPSKADQVQRYQHYVEIAKRWRQEEGYDDLWRRMVQLYSGQHFEEGGPTEDRIAVNIAKATVDVIVPSVSINHPKIICTPTTDEDSVNAAITEVVVNYQWRHFNFKKPIALAVKDSLVMGMGWVKVFWRYVEGKEDLSEEEFQQEVQVLNAQLDEAAAQNPLQAGDLPTQEDVLSTAPTQKKVVLEDRPYVIRLSPHDVMVDPESTSTDDMLWIAQRIVRPLDDAKRDPLYKPSARARLEPDGRIGLDWDTKGTNWRKKDSGIQRCTVWEFYDLRKKTMCVFSEGLDEYLVDAQPMPYACGHPFVLMPNYDVPDRFYAMGELEAMEDLQQELNKTRSHMMNARKKGGRKYMAREAFLTTEARNALLSDDDNQIIPIQDDAVPLDQIVIPLPMTQLPADYYQYSEIIESDVDRVTGINEYQRGSLPEVRRTATEASIIQDAANARAADKLAKVESFIAEIARKVIMLNQQYLTTPSVARIAGPQGGLWVPYSRQDIQGEFDFSVEAGSTLPNNETRRQQNALALNNIFAPYVGVLIQPEPWLAYIMKEMGVKQPEQYLIAGAGQMMVQQQMMQQQQENQANEIANEQAQAEAGKKAEQPNESPNKKGQVEQEDMGIGPTNGQGQAIPEAVMQQLMQQLGLNFRSQNQAVTY